MFYLITAQGSINTKIQTAGPRTCDTGFLSFCIVRIGGGGVKEGRTRRGKLRGGMDKMRQKQTEKQPLVCF